jgi:uncharacterized membrane protein
LNAFLHKDTNIGTFWSFLLAAILFFVGVGLVTIFKNVLLNEMLDKTVLEQASKLELEDVRKSFEKSWNRWHLIRTITSLSSFVWLLAGIIFSKS